MPTPLKQKAQKRKPVVKQPCVHCGDHVCVTCPNCGHTDDIDGFDCLGADEDKVFCNQCNHEFSA